MPNTEFKLKDISDSEKNSNEESNKSAEKEPVQVQMVNIEPTVEPPKIVDKGDLETNIDSDEEN